MKTMTIQDGERISPALAADVALSVKGMHREKLAIPYDHVRLLGEESARIVFDDHHGTCRDGLLFSTRHSATVTVSGKDFHAERMVFENDFGYLENAAYNATHPAAKLGCQAVALMLEKGSEGATFEECTFLGFTDTLYVDSGTSYFHRCHIEGNVDFIFGAGNAVFEECEILVRRGSGNACAIAPSTFIGQPGLVFRHCSFSSPDRSFYHLARPWHPSGSTDRCPEAIFEDCQFDEFRCIEPFASMDSRNPQGVCRTWTPEESHFVLV